MQKSHVSTPTPTAPQAAIIEAIYQKIATAQAQLEDAALLADELLEPKPSRRKRRAHAQDQRS